MLLYYLVLPIVLLTLVTLSIVPTILRPFDPSGRVYVWTMRTWSRLALALFRVKVIVRGAEHLDHTSNYIYVANHESYIDIPVIGANTEHDVVFVYKEELWRTPLWGPLLKRSPHVSISRTEGREAFATIEATARRIREGNRSVVVFPEGTRTADGSLGEFHRGAFLLATRAGVPIVPLAVRGTHELLPRDDWRVRSGTVELVFGTPIPVPEGVNRAQERSILEQTRGQLESMLA